MSTTNSFKGIILLAFICFSRLAGASILLVNAKRCEFIRNENKIRSLKFGFKKV